MAFTKGSKLGPPAFNQAQKIAKRFGGEVRLARVLGVSHVTTYRWSYPRPYGSDGLIPTMQVEAIKAVARRHGVILTKEDWFPERVTPRDETRLADLLK